MDSVDQSRSDGGSAPLLAMTGLVKRFTGDARARSRRLRRPSRRGPCAPRTERRGQVDADQNLGRGLRGRRRRDPVCRKAGPSGNGRAADRLHPPGSGARRVDDGRRERRDSDRLSAIVDRPHIVAESARRRRRGARDHGQRSRSRRRRSLRFRRPSARSSRSAGRWRSNRTSSFSTSRPRRFPRPTSNVCSTPCGDCAPATSESSTSPIDWTRSSASPIE